MIPPPDPCDYRVQIDLPGIYSFVVDKGDVPDYVTNPIELIDPLTINWASPESGLSYPQPGPMAATFAFVVQDMADVADLDVGHPVRIRVWVNAVTDLVAHFRGRVANLSARPHKTRGMIVTVTAVDYTVDLAETTIGVTAWPAETTQARTDRISAEAGVAVPPDWPIGADTALSTIALKARTASPTDARTQLVRLCDTVAEYAILGAAGGGVMARCFLVPNYPGGDADDAPDPLEPYALVKINDRFHTGGQGAAYAAPGTLTLLSTGLWGVAIGEHASYAGDGGVIDADYVDFKASWALGKRDHADTIVVTGPFSKHFGVASASDSVTVTGPDPVPVRLLIETDLDDDADAQATGMINLTAQDSDRWSADAFLFFADFDPNRLHIGNDGMLVFSDHDFPLTTITPWVVEGIPTEQNPTGVEWLAGQLSAATLTIAAGRIQALLRLRRNIARPWIETGTDFGYLSYSQLEDFKPDGAGLIANPGFEVNNAGYTGVNATLTRTLAQQHSGVASLQVQAPAAGNASVVDSGSGVGGIPVVANKAYRVPAWLRSAATVRQIQLRMDWWTAAGVFISQTVGTAVNDAVGGWTGLVEKFTAPATAARARRQCIVVGAALNEVHYLDDFDMWRTLTYADMDPRFSYYDYRIVRNPNA